MAHYSLRQSIPKMSVGSVLSGRRLRVAQRCVYA